MFLASVLHASQVVEGRQRGTLGDDERDGEMGWEDGGGFEHLRTDSETPIAQHRR